jgi:hypothetical protein
MTRTEIARLGGNTLAASVSRDYYRFIGRLGGRKYMYNLLMHIADNYQCLNCQHNNCKLVSSNPRGHERLVQEIKEHYRQEAYEKYYCFTGNRIFLELFQPDNS